MNEINCQSEILPVYEFTDVTVTTEIVRKYRAAFPELDSQAIYDRINADYKASDYARKHDDDLPPGWVECALVALPQSSKTAEELDKCDDCGKSFDDCACYDGVGLNSVFATVLEGAKERNAWGLSRVHDESRKFYGMRFQPVWEPGDEPDEGDAAYFGSHTFREDGITQLIRAASEATAAPEQLCAMVAAHTVSAMIGKGLVVSFAEGEKTPLGLYTMAFVRSGIGKTLISKILAGVLTDLHNERVSEWNKNTKPKLKAKKSLLTAKVKKLEKAFERGESEDLDEIINTKQQLAEIDQDLHAPVIYFDDVTIQRACQVLPITGEQLTYWSSDAVSGIQNLLGKYDKDSQTDDALILKSYSMEPFTQGRVGRDDVTAKAPWASICWLTQPDKWDRIRKNQSLMDGGALARFLMAEIKCELREDDGKARTIPPVLIQNFEQRCRQLFKTYREPAETDGLDPKWRPKVIRTTKDAAQMMLDWKNEIIRHQNESKDPLGQFPARWVENTKRLAGVLHAEYFGRRAHLEPLQVTFVEYAIKAMRWFIRKQDDLLRVNRRAAIEERQSQEYELCEKLKGLLDANGGKIKTRDAYKKLKVNKEELLLTVQKMRQPIDEDHPNTSRYPTVYIKEVTETSGRKTEYLCYPRVEHLLGKAEEPDTNKKTNSEFAAVVKANGVEISI